MKNILLIGLFLFTFISCKDYLEEENKSNILAKDYFKTSNGYEALVQSAYSSLREVYNQPWVFMAGTDCYVEGRNPHAPGLSDYSTLAPSDLAVTTFYASTYRAIQRCNAVVYYYDKTEASTTRDFRLGEVKFLRAYYHFLLVQSFGGVSIVEDYFEVTPATPFKRKSAEEVYSFIIKEMEEALTLLPEAASVGRVSKAAVKHFLAKVYLTRGYESFSTNPIDDFTKAAALADEAIGGKALTTTFENLFWPGNETPANNNGEVLFAIQYDKTSMKDLAADGNNQNYWFGPYFGGEGAKFGYPQRAHMLVPTFYVYNLFTADDSRWEGTFMNVFYSNYYEFYTKKADRANLTADYYFPQKWELADTTAWRAASAKRSKTKIIPFGTGWEATTATKDKESPAVRKFDDPTSIFASVSSTFANSSRDVFLARLGETYLVAAEAYFKLNDLAKAADRINVVRKRAAKTGKNLNVTPGQVNIDFILDERARELLGEYQRWFDLKRTGKLVSRGALYNRIIKKYGGEEAFKGIDGNLKILRPIPQAAIDLNRNDGFTQNPGY